MIEYRAYVIGEDGHIASFRAFVSDSDADAIVWAKQLVEGHDVELWSGDRFVIRLDRVLSSQFRNTRRVPPLEPHYAPNGPKPACRKLEIGHAI